MSGSDTLYALGSTEAEHERLIRQATLLAPCTERLFREAGIEPGHRVLDLGSGIGDVSYAPFLLMSAHLPLWSAAPDRPACARPSSWLGSSLHVRELAKKSPAGAGLSRE